MRPWGEGQREGSHREGDQREEGQKTEAKKSTKKDEVKEKTEEANERLKGCKETLG